MTWCTRATNLKTSTSSSSGHTLPSSHSPSSNTRWYTSPCKIGRFTTTSMTLSELDQFAHVQTKQWSSSRQSWLPQEMSQAQSREQVPTSKIGRSTQFDFKNEDCCYCSRIVDLLEKSHRGVMPWSCSICRSSEKVWLRTVQQVTLRLHMNLYSFSIGEGEGSLPSLSFLIIGNGKTATQPVAGEMLFCLCKVMLFLVENRSSSCTPQ